MTSGGPTRQVDSRRTRPTTQHTRRAPPVPRARHGARLASLPWYLLALATASIGIVWLVAKMARTDEADFRLLLIGTVAVVGGVTLVLSVVSRR